MHHDDYYHYYLRRRHEELLAQAARERSRRHSARPRPGTAAHAELPNPVDGVADLAQNPMPLGSRPAPAGGIAASLIFGWRALLKIKHLPEHLFDVTMFPVMFLLLFTYLFGGAVAGSTSTYLQDLLPGILAMTVLMITMYTGLTLNRDIERGVFDRFKSLPVWRPSTLLGPLLADALRYTLAATIILLLGYALGFRPGAGPVGVVLAVGLLLVFAFGLSWIWTLLGLRMRSEKALMSTSMLVLFPLSFLSNILVPTETLPGWLRPFVDANPISMLVSAMRGLMHGQPVAAETFTLLLVAAGLVAVFGPWTMRRYQRHLV